MTDVSSAKLSPAMRWAMVLGPIIAALAGAGGGFKLGQSEAVVKNEARIEMILHQLSELRQDVRTMRIRGSYTEGPLTEDQMRELEEDADG